MRRTSIISAAQLLHQLRPSPVTERNAALARKFQPDTTLEDRLERLWAAQRYETAQRMLTEMLRAKPGHLWLALKLLDVEEKLPVTMPDWLPSFQCPPAATGA